MPVVSDNGLKQTVTIRSGLMWNTSPPRPVTAADVVRGIKRACNPSPATFGGMADFEATIKGLTAYCTGYPAEAATNAAVMKQYIEGHNVSGITVSGNTITFTLTKPAPWLVGAMTLGAFNAVPIEAENGLPATPAVYDHMYSDGPYAITSYTPKKSIKLVRNPQWKASTDPLRKAYVNAINVDETGNQTTIYQQMPTGSASLGMSFDSLAPPAEFPEHAQPDQVGQPQREPGRHLQHEPVHRVQHRLAEQRRRPGQGGGAPGPRATGSSAASCRRSRRGRDQPRAHPRPAGRASTARRTCPANYDPYPYNPDKAKSMLAAAGFTASHPLQLKYLYRSDSQGGTAIFNNVVTQLNALGSVKVTGVPTNQSDFYGKYLQVPNSPGNPSPAYKGTWDLAGAGWGPDWYGNSAVTFFNPLFSSPGGFAANGGSNFGYFSSATVNNRSTRR